MSFVAIVCYAALHSCAPKYCKHFYHGDTNCVAKNGNATYINRM